MILKKYTADTTEKALDLAKKELGEDVILMHSKNVKPSGLFSFFRKSRIEVTVAKEESDDKAEAKAKAREADIREGIASIDRARQKAESAAAPAQDNAAKAQADEEAYSGRNIRFGMPEKEITYTEEKKDVESRLDNIQSLLEQKLSKDNQLREEEQRRAEAAEREREDANNAKRSKFDEFLKLIYKMLVDNEVTETVANQMIDEIEPNFSDDIKIEHILADIYQKIILKFGKPECIEPSADGAKVVFLVGPTGVGKTTTLAKIAANLKLVQHKRVAMFTTDTYRISAAEQLRTYSTILDAPFQIVYKAEEMADLYKEYKDYDYILVDTIGHSHHNGELKELTKSFLNAFEGIAESEIYLVLSATTKYRDLVAIANSYEDIKPYRLIFTKLDETDAQGNLLNLRMHTHAPMSYVTNGQNVPGDIKLFDAQETVKKLLGGH